MPQDEETGPWTSTQVAALARAAGLAGRGYGSWAQDDAVQRYLDDCGVGDPGDWEAAYAEGLLERRRTTEGWVERWTTAPADYDVFGTTTLATEGSWRDRPLRRVLVCPRSEGYQLSRYGSGLHGAWDEDPRETDRRCADQAARDRAVAAEREADRVAGLAWLAAASDAEIDDALDRGEGPLGVTRAILREEVRRRATAAREADYERCLGLVAAREVLVDDGAPAQASRWGTRPGRPPCVYYAVSVDDHPRDADRAMVHARGAQGSGGGGGGGGCVGSLASVARRLEEGTLRGARLVEVPPEPVLRRVGHDHLASVRRVEAAGRVVWTFRPAFAREALILDDRGRVVRARAIVSAIEKILDE